MPRVRFSLAIHNHQPVGNFPHVFDAAYTQSYLPMLEALERHPGIPVALHYSGPLLDWLEASHPEFFPRLRVLVARNQVELLTGGYYEPILPIISERDRQGQIHKMSAYLRRRFGATPSGLWLAERVWEPHLARSIAQSGATYTIVDDAHFLAAGWREDALRGYFVTEDEGVTLKIFPSLRRLRYLIPWGLVDDVMNFLRRGGESGESANRDTGSLLLMGDDGEKFGLWPGTYAHCWEGGWVEAFFAALEGAGSWLEVVTPAVAVSQPAAGRAYLPTASYDEMTEWALPADRSAAFAEIKHRMDESGDPAAAFLRGGYWRHFFIKYPEINTLHKKMLRVSAKVWRMRPGRRREQALNELWQAQCNCPYWHGVFGGAYLPHIRRANFAHLIAAEALADRDRRGPGVTVGDYDADGADEVELASPAMVVTIDPTDGGGVVEWDWRKRRINLTNVLTRRPEASHRQLREASGDVPATAGAPETIHTTRVRVKEEGLQRLLIYDRYRRSSFLDHFLGPDVKAEAFLRGAYDEYGTFVDSPYAFHPHRSAGQTAVSLVRDGEVKSAGEPMPVRVAKRLTLDRRSPHLVVDYQVTNTGGRRLATIFAVETNWAITDPASPVRVNGQTRDARTVPVAEGVERVEFTDFGWDGDAALEFPPARLWLLPLETVSNSEAGFERIFQGITCLCAWPVELDPGQTWETIVRAVLEE